MKSFAISIIICIFAPLSIFAQSEDHNYIMQKTMLDENGQNSVTTVEYYDGLGRKVQSISNGVVPGYCDKSLLSRTVYDGMGREGQRFLSVSATGLDFTDDVAYRNNDQKALSEISYDALGRTVSVTTPGSDMRGKSKNYSYGTNTAGEVKHYTVGNGGSLSENGCYPSGALTRQRVTDEDNHSVETYTNLFGEKVLERRRISNNTTADTYYVYNDCGFLCYVLQPMYQSNPVVDMYAFRYSYDSRGRMVEKIIPGCEKITYTYDDADRMLTMQDGEMRKKGDVMHYAYDDFGRLQTQTLCSQDAQSIMVRNYYDGDYAFLNDGTVSLTTVAKSLLLYSGSMGTTSATSKQLGCTFTCGTIQRASDGTEIVTVMFYDAKGRVVEKNSQLHNCHFRREQFTYTFTGQVKTHTTIDYGNGPEYFRSVLTNNYDSITGILTSTDLATSTFGTKATRRIADYKYDDYGRVTSNTCGSVTQTTSYDVRDWPTQLKSTNFTEQLKYTGPYYNGNIGSAHYTGPCYDYTYQYGYDRLDRLTSASYYNYHEPEEDWAEPAFDEYANYDKNGNVTKIQRLGFPDEGEYIDLIDDLDLTYNGNQLAAVEDNMNDPTYMTTKNFIQNSNASIHYTYNANGALLTDANNGDNSLGVDCNRGIVYTEYDTFGYPKAVYYGNGRIMRYVYSPDGQKLRTEQITPLSFIRKPMGQPFTLTSDQILSTTVKDYWGDDVICTGGYPSMFLFAGGYADIKNHTTMTWHYYVKDHLGSNRIVQDENGNIEASYNYFPFGNEFEHYGEIYGYNRANQPYKFSGKESEWLRGTYDFGARQYDPLLCRWTSVDPLCEKYYSVSPYVYCMNNPVKMVDPDGRAPGDFFYTITLAAKDFGKFYNDNSIRDNREYASFIFQIKNERGVIGYTYSIANVGDKDSSIPINVPGAQNIATIHTHAAYDDGYFNDTFSGAQVKSKDNTWHTLSAREKIKVTSNNDIGNANRRKMDSYVVTPNGSLQKYSPSTGKINVISNDMPSDANDPDRMNIIGTNESCKFNLKQVLEALDQISQGILYNNLRK